MPKNNKKDIAIFSQNIRKVFLDASNEEIRAGLDWYQEAHEFAKRLAEQYQIPLETVAGVIVAISPNCSWEQNKKDAETLISAYKRNPGRVTRVRISTWSNNRLKAIRILRTNKPEAYLNPRTGPKTHGFYHNIAFQSVEHVTIDRHAFGVLTGIRYSTPSGNGPYYHMTPYKYRTGREAYKQVASEVGLQPYQLQAITWLTWKRKGEDQ